MALVFNPAEIPTESEAVMAANLPAVGHLYYFFDTDKGGDIYSIDSNGNIVFVADKEDDCCACELTASWLCALNEALNGGAMTAAEYQTAIQAGFTINSTNTGGGNCSIVTGITFTRLISLSITPRPTALAIQATVQLAVVATPTGSDARVVWVTSDATKATVSTSGLVTGVALGSVTITAYSVLDGSISDSITISVG